MYLVYGIDHHGNESKRLEYATIEEALHKVSDLIGADEIDDNGPMFSGYVMAIDPMPQGPCTEGLYDKDGNRIPELEPILGPGAGHVPVHGIVPPPEFQPPAPGLTAPGYAPEDGDDGPKLRLHRD